MTMSDNEWYKKLQRMTTKYNESQEVTTNDNEWQQMTASGTTNENDTVHFKEWMTAIKHKKKIHYFKGWMTAIRVVK